MALAKLIADIRQEDTSISLEPQNCSAEQEIVWDRIGTKNKLSGTEARSIFSILKKKYTEESAKPNSSWKLLKHLSYLDDLQLQYNKQMDVATLSSPIEEDKEDTYIELLEVKEEDFSDDEYTPRNSSSEFRDEVKPSEFRDEVKPIVNAADSETFNKGECSSTTPEARNGTSSKPQKRKRSDVSTANDNDKNPEKRIAAEPLTNQDDPKIHQKDIELSITKISDFNSFGTFVANTLSSLPPRLSAKLEIKLLQAIIDVKSESLDPKT